MHQEQDTNSSGVIKPRPFDHRELNVRVTWDEAGAIWYVVKDICEVLGLTNASAAAAWLDHDERSIAKIDTEGGPQDMLVVNDSGLYAILIRSDREEAKPFRKWITGELMSGKGVLSEVLAKMASIRNERAPQSGVNPISFSFEGRGVRVITDDTGAPWWVASDVAAVLGYRDSAAACRCVEEDEKGTHIVCTPGGHQEMTVISESGLYALIIKSRRPEATPFRRWVTSDVLPTLRKTGHYEMPGRGTVEPGPSGPAMVTGQIVMVNMLGYVLHIMNGRAMIQDKELARHIGYQNPVRLRGQIEALLRARVVEADEVLVETALPPGLLGGRPYRCYYLDARGAIKVAVRSRLPGSAEVVEELEEVFATLDETDMMLPRPAAPKRPTPPHSATEAADMLTGFIQAGLAMGSDPATARAKAADEVKRLMGVDFSAMFEPQSGE